MSESFNGCNDIRIVELANLSFPIDVNITHDRYGYIVEGPNLFQDYVKEKLFPSIREKKAKYRDFVITHFLYLIISIIMFISMFMNSKGFTLEYSYIVDGFVYGVMFSMAFTFITIVLKGESR